MRPQTSGSPGLSIPGSDVESHHDAGERSSKQRKTGSNRVRRKTACQSCRMRKVKCDAIRPSCGICRASETVCYYTDPFPEKLTLDSATDLLYSKLNDIQKGIDSLQNIDHAIRNGRLDNNAAISINQHDSLHSPELRRQASTAYHTDPSTDGLFSRIPAHRTTADTVLNWEVFEGKYPPMSFIGVLFTPAENDLEPFTDSLAVSGGMIPPNEEQMPQLVDRFLQNVHTKNPVLDVEELVKQARIVASSGLGWDAWSCMVLLAAALGTIAKPFDAAVIVTPSAVDEPRNTPTWIPDAINTEEELQQAESCFVLACRRLGTLKHSILGSHCYFFAGVYLMYTLRPLLSWQYFAQASNLFQIYIKRKYGLSSDISQLGQLPIHYGETSDKKRKRLEESMYWSCFKSETEFRVELPLPQSEIASYYHPQLFPSPPSPAGLEMSATPGHNMSESPRASFTSNAQQAASQPSPSLVEDMNLRRHAKQLCNEEESWYYYLTEIALRRIGNRIINTFFDHHLSEWMDVRPLLSIALEFDTQVSSWSAHLPDAMQHWETNYTIRAPGSVSPVSRELSWATENRLLEMRSWLYQPFLYYFIHKSLPQTHPDSILPINGSMPRTTSRDDFINASFNWPEHFSPDDADALYHFITAGIENNLTILNYRSLRHRHHGLWFDMRSLVCASLILLAIAKAGQEDWIPGGVEMLWGATSGSHPHDLPVSGQIGHVLAEIDHWASESTDLKRHRDVLEDVTRMVQDVWARTKRG